MSNLLGRSWYPGARSEVRQTQPRMSWRRPREAEVEQEPDWLGWDGWVSTEDVAATSRDPSNAS